MTKCKCKQKWAKVFGACSDHLDVVRRVLEVVLAVLHLVSVLALGDVGHLSLGLVLQQQDGRRNQDAQDHLENTHTRACALQNGELGVSSHPTVAVSV